MVRAWRDGRSGFGRMRSSGRSVSRRLAPGVSVAQVARRYAVNANPIFKFLRDPRFAPDPASVPAPSEEARFLPVEIVGAVKEPPAAPVVDNCIEIELAGGHGMRIGGSYDPEALARLIRGVTA